MVGWVIGVAVLSILLMPIVYYPLSVVWDTVSAFILGNYTFTGVTASSYIVAKVIVNYLLVFGLIFTLNWAIIQAKARRYLA